MGGHVGAVGGGGDVVGASPQRWHVGAGGGGVGHVRAVGGGGDATGASPQRWHFGAVGGYSSVQRFSILLWEWQTMRADIIITKVKNGQCSIDSLDIL